MWYFFGFRYIRNLGSSSSSSSSSSGSSTAAAAAAMRSLDCDTETPAAPSRRRGAAATVVPQPPFLWGELFPLVPTRRLEIMSPGFFTTPAGFTNFFKPPILDAVAGAYTAFRMAGGTVRTRFFFRE